MQGFSVKGSGYSSFPVIRRCDPLFPAEIPAAAIAPPHRRTWRRARRRCAAVISAAAPVPLPVSSSVSATLPGGAGAGGAGGATAIAAAAHPSASTPSPPLRTIRTHPSPGSAPPAPISTVIPAPASVPFVRAVSPPGAGTSGAWLCRREPADKPVGSRGGCQPDLLPDRHVGGLESRGWGLGSRV